MLTPTFEQAWYGRTDELDSVDLAWFAAASALFLGSSAVHAWQTRQSHLGPVTWPIGRNRT